MKPKLALQKLKPLLKQPYFTSEEATASGVATPILSHYIKTGDLVRFGRGLYGGAHSSSIIDFRWEDLIKTVTQIKQGVICLISALALYNLTEEIPRQHWIAIPNDTRHRSAKNVRIVRLRNMTLGKATIHIDRIRLPIFDRERTIVDSFRYLGKETALKALREALSKRGSEKIDIEKIRRYSKRLHVKIEPYLLVFSL